VKFRNRPAAVIRGRKLQNATLVVTPGEGAARPVEYPKKGILFNGASPVGFREKKGTFNRASRMILRVRRPA